MSKELIEIVYTKFDRFSWLIVNHQSSSHRLTKRPNEIKTRRLADIPHKSDVDVWPLRALIDLPRAILNRNHQTTPKALY